MSNQTNRPTEKFRTSVGGQALMEGIMMRGPEKIACAVRRPDGTITVARQPDIGCSSGGSDASRVDTSVRGDIVDLAARRTDIH